MSSAPIVDFEQGLDEIRRFYKNEMNSIMEAEDSGTLAPPELFHQLSLLADEVVLKSYTLTENEFLNKLPNLQKPKGSFSVVAMGKWAGLELNYHSDLDLIFIIENSDDFELYSRFAARFINSLSLHTREGNLYRIDTELRPSGNYGALVTSIKSFEDYHRSEGKNWERQSLIRSRVITGTPEFKEKVTRLIRQIVFKNYTTDELKTIMEEMTHLRARMEKEIAKEKSGQYNLKSGYGGLIDIEFITQFIQLQEGHKLIELQTPNILQALKIIELKNILPSPLAKELGDAYLFIRMIETRLRKQLGQSTDVFWVNSSLQFEESAKEKLLETRNRVRQIYKQILKVA